MSRRSYSLRQQLDLIAGGLLVCIVLGGCLALELARRQHRDATLLNALHAQEDAAAAMTQLGETLVSDWTVHHRLDPSPVAAFHAALDEFAGYLDTFRRGGALAFGDGRQVRVGAVRDPLIAVQLNAALESAALYRKRVDGLLAAEPSSTPEARLAAERDLARFARELQTVVRGLALAAESHSLRGVVRASQIQLIVMLGGVLMFLLGVFILRRFVTTPLHRMADGIEAMQRTGRLVKLPVISANELGVVAEGFNRLSEQVEEQKRRLREHIVELQRMNLELDRLAALKDDFLETVNHQLRTPLTTIIEGLELIRDGTLGHLTQEQQMFIQTLDQNAAQLSHLIEEILDLSLLKSGRRPLKRQPGDLAALLRQAQADWQHVASSSRTVSLTCDALPAVYMDDEAIREVTDHLLRNALRHAPERSSVLIVARAHDGAVEVAVQDHGAGLTPKQLAQLFQPFSHVQTPDAPGSEGGGLGLAYCQQVIERHHGSIRADSIEGSGTTVTFVLPVASTQFLFEEACRTAKADAEHEHGQFAALLICPADPGTSADVAAELVRRAETVLRRNTHRGDQFLWLDDRALAIVAVADQAGLESMAARLRRVLADAQVAVQLLSVRFPADGDSPQRLFEAARHLLSHRQPLLPRVRIAGELSPGTLR